MSTAFNSRQVTLTNIKYRESAHVQMCVDAFLVDRKARNLSAKTITFYRERLGLFLDYCDKRIVREIVDITPELLREYFMYLSDTGHNPGGVHACYRCVKTLLRWYESEMEPDNWKNPIYKVKAPKIPENILSPVEIDTVYSLIDVCERGTFIGDRDSAILLCLLDTGCRVQEFLNINLNDVNMITGAIFIRKGKGGKSRTVFIGKKARKYLRAYLKHRNDNGNMLWITEDRTERMSFPAIRSMITRRANKANISPIPSLHSFRRAFAINMLRNGIDLLTLSKLMGHSDILILKKYLKLLPEDLQIAHVKYSPVDNYHDS